MKIGAANSTFLILSTCILHFKVRLCNWISHWLHRTPLVIRYSNCYHGKIVFLSLLLQNDGLILIEIKLSQNSCANIPGEKVLGVFSVHYFSEIVNKNALSVSCCSIFSSFYCSGSKAGRDWNRSNKNISLQLVSEETFQKSKLTRSNLQLLWY